MAIEIITAIADMQARAEELRCRKRRIAFVPTMGYLHEGHLSLMRVAKRHADILVASIFVNPAQFGPNEDLDTYPRDLERDLELLRQEGVDIVFTPQAEAIYPAGYETFVALERLPQHLCGLSRPVFFRGVATVVTKLFNIVRPHVAVFGAKDYQQLIVVRRMVQDLNLDIDIIGAPIVREADGLAMSSRNAYLTPAQRPAALGLFHALQQAQAMVATGEQQSAVLVAAARNSISAHADTVIDYVEICDPQSLEQVAAVLQPALMALAVRVGHTRLIDNCILDPRRSM